MKMSGYTTGAARRRDGRARRARRRRRVRVRGVGGRAERVFRILPLRCQGTDETSPTPQKSSKMVSAERSRRRYAARCSADHVPGHAAWRAGVCARAAAALGVDAPVDAERGDDDDDFVVLRCPERDLDARGSMVGAEAAAAGLGLVAAAEIRGKTYGDGAEISSVRSLGGRCPHVCNAVKISRTGGRDRVDPRRYDARTRAVLKDACRACGSAWAPVAVAEAAALPADYVREGDDVSLNVAGAPRKRSVRLKTAGKVLGTAVGGGALLALSGAVAAPSIAATLVGGRASKSTRPWRCL